VKLIAVRIRFCLIVALALSGGGLRALAQHVHLYAGAASQQPGSKLIVVNAVTYDINSNGGTTPECFFMSDNYPELYPGLYQSDATFAALPATLCAGGPAPNCAALGTYIEARLVSVTGPKGGEIGFWQENEDATETTKVFSVPSGTSSTNRFNVSEGFTFTPFPDCGIDPDGHNPDPFGHIHGRRFTANKLGLYIVGFQLIDTATNGLNGASRHAPSVTNYFYFQAGLNINTVAKTNSAVTVGFGARPFANYDFQISTNLATTNWFTIESYIGNFHSHLQHLTDPNATNAARFYRLQEFLQ